VSIADADDAAVAFGDPGLHDFTGGRPASAEQLRERYGRWHTQRSPDGSQAWLNWMVRLRESGSVVGTVQGTVELRSQAPAVLAWVTAVDHQRSGIATEAADAVATWLRTQPGVGALSARIHPAHLASQHIARRIGLHPQPEFLEDGEQLGSDRPVAG
jgi:RimJ/RimL family protein N-acetyltransferase